MKTESFNEACWLLAIPSYNNRATLKQLLIELLPHHSRLLVVDDGSTDGTELERAAFPNVQWISHGHNQGKGAALVTALRFAKKQGYRTMIAMDADGQHRPVDLEAIVEKSESSPGAIVIGDRDFDSPQSGHVPKSSRFGRSFSNFWVKLETGLRLNDTQSGFRAYPVEAITRFSFARRHYDFEIEVLVRAAWCGIPIVSVPISVHYPVAAERVSHFRPYLDNFRLSTLHSCLVLKRWTFQHLMVKAKYLAEAGQN